MPKYKFIPPFTYEYQCECGKTIKLESDVTPERLIKCFECQIKLHIEEDEKG